MLIPPLPRHGMAERQDTAHSHLPLQELAAYADRVVDIAQGLGERVTMMGLSCGGVTSAWAAPAGFYGWLNRSYKAVKVREINEEEVRKTMMGA